jgi:hypothetical protein
MTPRKVQTDPFGDIEKQHPTVRDSVLGEGAEPPLTVRLGGLWSDLMRVSEELGDDDSPPPHRPPSAVPLLDDMKGILQWD